MKRCECSVCSPLPSTGILITSEGEVVTTEEKWTSLPCAYCGEEVRVRADWKPGPGTICRKCFAGQFANNLCATEIVRLWLFGLFRLVRVLQVIERGARWTAQDLEAELSK